MSEETPNTEASQTDNLPEITATAEDSGTLKKKISVTVPRARIDAKFNQMFGELASSALVPGFRVGHAPRRLLEKRFGKDVAHDVRNSLVGESLTAAIKTTGLEKTLGEPDLDLEKIEIPEKGDMTFSFEVEVPPEFELPKLDGIKVTRPKMEVNEQNVTDYIEQLRSSRAQYAETEEAAAEGDAIVGAARITLEGTEPIERPGLTLRVAPGQVEGLPLMDLGKELTGKKASDTVKMTVKVPDTHANEAWRGKDAAVEITVSQVRRRTLPEVNEEFAKALGFENMDDLRKFLQLRLQQRLAEDVQRSMQAQVRKYLLDNTKFDLPEGVAARHAIAVLRRRYVDLLYQGVPREQIDENLTKLQAAATEQSQTELKVMFVLDKVAEAENISVAEAEVNARIAQMAVESGRRPERLRQELESEGSLEQVELSLREEKAIAKLLERAEVTEQDTPAEKA